MKKTFALFILLYVSAAAFGQKVTSDLENAYEKRNQRSSFADVEREKKEIRNLMKEWPIGSDEKFLIHYLSQEEASSYIPVAQKIDKILRNRRFDKLKKLCTKEGWTHVQKLLINGNAIMDGYPNIQFLEKGAVITLRSFPMAFRFNNNDRIFNEDVVFHINREGKITRLALALDKHSITKVFCSKGIWSDEVKQAIVNFMESYKTAIVLRDIDRISSYFSDETLFIGEKIYADVSNKSDPTLRNSYKDPDLRNKKARELFFKHYEKMFAANEYINTKFGDVSVKKVGNSSKFGIQFRQQLFSEHNSDDNFIFLAVDFTNTDNPTIPVTAIQSEVDVNKNGRLGIQDISW